MRFVRILLSLMLAAFAAGANAADGVVDFIIDPSTGYAITVPGSYRLTADVVMTNPNVNAVTILAANVTLDLNGHTINGGVQESGGSSGVAGFTSNVTVRNGRIASFRGRGVILTGDLCAASDLNVSACPTGIRLEGAGVVVSECQVGSMSLSTPGDIYGILVGGGGAVRDCVVANNVAAQGNSTGIEAGSNSTVERNNCSGNVSVGGGVGCGISSGPGCTIRGNTCSDNNGAASAYGIRGGAYNLIEGNTCNTNKGTISGPAHGISAANFSKVLNNSCVDNDVLFDVVAFGIEIGGYSLVEGNFCAGHTSNFLGFGIIVNGTRNVIRRNTTAANGTAGIRLDSDGNRCEANILGDGTPLSDFGGNSIGTGDLANVDY